MKKLYHKGAVHPSPPLISDQLAFLPAAILALAAALPSDDREILAYLLSCSSRRRNAAVESDHAPLFSCSCFACYTSYWVRWDESPNRQLIHEIIDAFEDNLEQSSAVDKGKKNGKGKKEKRNKKGCSSSSSNNKHARPTEFKRSELAPSPTRDSPESEPAPESDPGAAGEAVLADEKGSVRKFVSFIGERIWGAWGQ